MRFSECKKDRNQFYDTKIRCRMPIYPYYPACQENMQHLRALISCSLFGFRYYSGNMIFFSNASSLTSRTRLPLCIGADVTKTLKTASVQVAQVYNQPEVVISGWITTQCGPRLALRRLTKEARTRMMTSLTSCFARERHP